jgi:undecaprenyl-diphosphatase
MTFLQIAILAVIQGLAELLPVSSSAHVIVAEKLIGLDPSSPEMTLLLVLLHTGTMFAVLLYFWGDWKRSYFLSLPRFKEFAKQLVWATLATGAVGLLLMVVIEKVYLRGTVGAEVEMLFGNLRLISVALAAAGLLILYASFREKETIAAKEPGTREALIIGLIQGLCLPFRGFSRSGATISTGLILKVGKIKAEEFSFALAVVLTPPVLVREIHRLIQARAALGVGQEGVVHLLLPGLLGMVVSFLAGLLALKWLSSWLTRGRWKYFGIYCLAFSGVVWMIHLWS